jgi:hypothetical protein
MGVLGCRDHNDMDDPSLIFRLSAGLGILAIFLIVDLRRCGWASLRLREYAFLLCTTATAVVYASVSDAITVRVSWEYFWYGKGLGEAVDYATPVDQTALAWQAAWLGVRAGWSPGLLLGAILLMANNPGLLPRLRHGDLYRLLPTIIAITAITALVGAVLGRMGCLDGLVGLSSEEAAILDLPAFITVWGVHLGTYAGALLGTIASAVRIRRSRRLLGLLEAAHPR